MRYSLLSRFQGTLLGAALGEVLGTALVADGKSNRSLLNFSAGQWASESSRLTRDGWSQMAIACADRLIQTGNPADLTPVPSGAPSSPKIGIAIATLPIALFFHENQDQLHHHLQQTASSWQTGSEIKGGVLAVGHAIALALQEQLNPLDLIPQLLTELNLATHSPLFTHQLQQVQICLEQQVGLARTISLLSLDPDALPLSSLGKSSLVESSLDNLSIAAELTALALSFYCFLSTPEDYALSLLRSAYGAVQMSRLKSLLGLPSVQIMRLMEVMIALTGALSGAYNSLAGIPTDWRIKLYPFQDSPLVGLGDLSPVDKIEGLAAQFLAVWAGAAWSGNTGSRTVLLRGNSIDQTNPSSVHLPIAAPHVIRPR
jgi:ADP-ribosylglycohydrolase